MNRRFLFVGLLVLFVFVSGCRASRSIKKGIEDYAKASTPEERFEEALDRNKLDLAEEIWLENRDYFLENPDLLARAGKAAGVIRDRYTPKVSAATTNLLSVRWPVKSAQWPLVRLKMDNARNLIDEIETNAVLTELDNIPPGLDKLKTLLREREQQIRTDVPNRFRKYPLLSAPSFFSIYPVSVDAEELLKSQAAFLERTMADASRKEITHMVQTYGDIIPPETLRTMEGRYFRSLLSQESGKGRTSFRTVIKAMMKAREQGFPITEVPDCKIAFLRVTSKSMLMEHCIEFGLGFDMDLPVKAEQLAAKTMYDSNTAGDADIVVLINETASKLDRKTYKPTIMRSKAIIGYRESYNQEFDQAQMVLEQHRLKREELNDRANVNMVFGLIGAALSIPIANAADREEEKYNSALANATKIPRMVEKPIYQNYSYQVIPLNTAKVASVQFVIIDRKARTYFADVFNIVQKRTFRVAYGVNADDPSRVRILSSYNTDKEVRDWEIQPVDVKLSELLGYYLEHREKDRKYSNVAQIRRVILNNRNKALEEFYADKYGSDTGNDPRFDSTVVIMQYRGGYALGSGFFVTDNIILTNNHVVAGSDYAEIQLHNNMETYGRVIAVDTFRDLALIKVGIRGKPVRFYTKNSIPAGVTLEAIGHPLGYKYTITRGVFSAYRQLKSHMVPSKDRKIRYIQTDAAINNGNSGGPLFYKDRVVGVNSWGFDEADNISFAVHYSEVIKFLKQYGIKYRT
ncbi:S1C family serine protease [Maridesulfovibrio sp.]|uniref:S1C family serine protease n=1 Tax=Maridesulfovibrio sp. TaxID=2795000 RepID=UPI002A18A4E3|nr:S1C family serine protease [Maridesulfovibrio sp.]